MPCIVLAGDDSISTVLAASAINAFAIDIYKVLASEGGNVFFSPYSISAALTMTFAGARGETADEMANVLRFAGNEDQIHPSMRKLQNHFDSITEEQGIIDMANRLWLERRYELLPEFTTTVERYYDAGVESIDFSRAPNVALLIINDWIARQTRDKIKDILSQGTITSSTRLVLTNAIYFHSVWDNKFDKANTRDLPFYTGLNEYKLTPMMSNLDTYIYGENNEMQWIRIPYNIPNVSMFVILPRENETFTQLEVLEKSLTTESLTRMLSRMRSARVDLQFPRFKDEQMFSLASVLSALGMPSAFRPDADFSGIMETEAGLYIDSVVHKAFIEVDEEGTEAAAATVILIEQTATTLRKFHANRPFIYFIYDGQTRTILFMGRKIEV